MNRARAAVRLWGWPVILAVLIVVGLLSALMGGDGAFRWLCWFALSVPLAIAMRALRSGSIARARR